MKSKNTNLEHTQQTASKTKIERRILNNISILLYFQSPKPEQSVMQALESLNEQQVSNQPSHNIKQFTASNSGISVSPNPLELQSFHKMCKLSNAVSEQRQGSL